MNRKTVRRIYLCKKNGAGYKPSRWKRPPSAKFVRKMVAKRIVRNLCNKLTVTG